MKGGKAVTRKNVSNMVMLTLGLVAFGSISEDPTLQAQGLIKKPGQPPQNRQLLNVTDQLTVKDAMDRVLNNSYCKVYTLEMIPGNTYVIDHMSSKFDCYLRVEDENGNNLAQDDDGGNGLNSRIVFSPTRQGNYRICATSLGGRSVGQFTLTVQLRQMLFSTSGKLTPTDPMDVVRQGCHFKVFRVKMEKNKTYTIDLMGNYDPYIRLEDSRGNPRGEDDDSGGSLNARLIFRPQVDDEYRIIVTSCSGGRVGNYSLTVSD
jgi:hypothetical protein